DFPEIRSYSGILEWLVVPPVLFWMLMMFLIKHTADALLEMHIRMRYQALVGWFVLLAAWMFFTRLHAFHGPDMTLYFLILIWLADIAAFFVGKKYGETKLAPVVSPGKTVAGFYAALTSAAVCAIVLSLVFGYGFIIGSDFLLLSLLTVLISIYGDLFFSLVKRRQGVKDSGSILPGHGGILDRIDSLIAAIPLFYAGIMLIRGQL
ncbi:MAG: phosphatidate cytidylyltransferase, partial [Gammaproteobacteria bacterium]